MSRGENEAQPTGDAQPATADFNDAEFVSQLLGASDLNDPLVQAALAQLRSSNAEEKKENDKKRKKEDE